ncbi:hypothetical protein B2J96_04625 [Mycobacterium shigaense]|nr:hypothetical protein B2J96_04625 [Mycobacterium shigaense]
MSGTNEVSDETQAAEAPQPRIQILKGEPTDAELAALITVLGCAGGTPPQPPAENTRWGLPVDKLRFAMSNYQRLTLQQITHMKRR